MIEERSCEYLRTRLVVQLRDLENDYSKLFDKCIYEKDLRYINKKVELTSAIRILNIVLEKDILNYDL